MIEKSVREVLARMWSIARAPWPVEVPFALVTLLIGHGMISEGPSFAKLGIPISIPAWAGGIPNQKIALFIFELYILFLAALCFLPPFKFREFLPPKFKEYPLWYLTFGLFVVGMLRLLPDLSQNPILGIRNASFVWYLIVPLMIFRLKLRLEFLEALMYVFSFYLFLLLVLDLSWKIPAKIISIQWYVTSGSCLGAWALAFMHKRARVYLPLMLVFCSGLSLNLMERISRTTLLGLFSVLGVLGLHALIQNRKLLLPLAFRSVQFVLLFCGCFLVFASPYYNLASKENNAKNSFKVNTTMSSETLIQSMSRGEETTGGLEGFRTYLWLDAWRLFQHQPLLGIGFQKPVVYRIYQGDGDFRANDGTTFLQLPPVSGPHNSYLNALARMGIIGIGFFILHLAALWTFWSRAYFAAFFIFLGQMLYAFLNVGLEGPARSYLLIIALGMALKISWREKSRAGFP